MKPYSMVAIHCHLWVGMAFGWTVGVDGRVGAFGWGRMYSSRIVVRHNAASSHRDRLKCIKHQHLFGDPTRNYRVPNNKWGIQFTLNSSCTKQTSSSCPSHCSKWFCLVGHKISSSTCSSSSEWTGVGSTGTTGSSTSCTYWFKVPGENLII